jgi:hypothetical protein
MTDPFTTWSRLSSAWLAMAQTGINASRMVETSGKVATARTGMIGTAMRTPLEGDYAELGRMVPEKLVAFGKAASVVGDEWLSMQTAFIAEAQVAAAMTLRGRPPTPAEWTAQATRSVAFTTRTVERLAGLAGLALAPIDATVKANARRLKAVSAG